MNYNETMIINNNSSYLFGIFISGVSFIGILGASMVLEYIQIKLEKNKKD